MYIERRAWQWVDWALFGILTSGLTIGLLYLGTIPGMGSLFSRVIIISWALLCYFITLVFWRPGYTHLWGLPLSILITSGSLELYLSLKSGEAISVITVSLLIVGFHSKGKQLMFNGIAFIVALPLMEALLLMPNNQIDFPLIINRALNMGLLLAIGFGIQRLWFSHYGVKQLYEENLRVYRLVQEQNKALEQYANQVEKLTLVEERNRLARELHDTVGHTFTSVIMGMDAVSYLMETSPDKAREKLDVLRQVTRSGLEEVRRSIHQIAPPSDEGTFMQQMARLAHEFALHTGTQVKIKPYGDECELPKQLELTMIRCLQEALTNAKRHGQASTVDIRMDYGEKKFTLTITDNGTGSDEIETGFGLTAMKERLGSLQGTLEINSIKGTGLTVICSVPIRRLPQQAPVH
jgi:signal transduction histidine kinase